MFLGCGFFDWLGVVVLLFGWVVLVGFWVFCLVVFVSVFGFAL